MEKLLREIRNSPEIRTAKPGVSNGFKQIWRKVRIPEWISSRVDALSQEE